MVSNSNKYKYTREVEKKADTILREKFETVKDLIVNKINNDPAFIRAKNKADEGKVRGNIAGVSICNLPSTCNTGCNFHQYNIESIRIDKFYAPYFNSYIDFEEYFNNEEKEVITDYFRLFERVSKEYNDFSNLLYKADTVAEFRKSFNIDKMFEGL